MSKISSPWRQDFPMINQTVHNKPLVYLDTAASALTPQCVIDRIDQFYQQGYANVHRGIHHLSSQATQAMEQVRHDCAQFLSAASEKNIVFTSGTTASINHIAQSFVQSQCQAGDEIIITELEHHANIVPWQMMAEMAGVEIKVWPINAEGQLNLEQLKPLLSHKTKLLAMSQLSNVLGVHTPVKEAIALAKSVNAATLIDGAQGALHHAVDVTELDCDFYVFSGHKLYGPTGIGVLYMHQRWFDALPPWHGGGAMIDKVCLPTGTTYQDAPWKFETGTPHVAGILGLGAAIEYINQCGWSEIEAYQTRLMNYALEQLKNIDQIVIYGPQDTAPSGMISFNLGSHHAFDVGSFLDRYGVAIRTGHHCAMPLLQRLEVPAVCRASFGLYNDQNDVDILVDSLKRTLTLLG